MHISIATRTTELCDRLREYVRRIEPGVRVETWNNPAALMHRSDYSDWDIVITESCEDDGDTAIRLAQRISEMSPQTGVIIISQDDKYMKDAFDAHVQAYLIEPITEEQLRKELCYYAEKCASLKFADENEFRSAHVFQIREDNGFDCLIDGIPVRFKHNKTRDAIEYLVSRKGAMVEDKEILDALWGNENKSSKSYLRVVKAEIVKLFNDVGCGDAIVKYRGRMGIMTDKLM